MSDTRTPNTIFFVILAIGILDGLRRFPMLPERLASHFGPSGMPNGWMTKEQFYITYALVLIPALVVEFLVGRRISRKGDARINLPNKEYWLAPERREETFAYFRRFFAWYGCALLALLVYVMGLTLRANLDAVPRLPTTPTIAAIALFVLYNVAAIVAMLRHFQNPNQ
jgi:uncharacterized membrane protein